MFDNIWQRSATWRPSFSQWVHSLSTGAICSDVQQGVGDPRINFSLLVASVGQVCREVGCLCLAMPSQGLGPM